MTDLGTPGEAWQALQRAYCDGLGDAGWEGDLAVVRRSMAVSTNLRLGWAVDHLLAAADRVPDEMLLAVSSRLRLLADLNSVAG